jgi:hypothetical protein
MKKFTLLLVFVSVVLFHNPKSVLAYNIAACDLTYVCLGGNDYLITVTYFWDCRGNIPSDSTILVNFISTCDTFTSVFSVHGIPETISTTCSCCPQINCCDSNFPGCVYGIMKYVYQNQVTLPTCSDWVIWCNGGSRNVSDDLSNPTSQNLYMHSSLNNLMVPCNSSPQFTNDPLTLLCENQNSCYNQGAFDPDGDSLVYFLEVPQVAAGVPVTYNTGYSASYPIPSNPPLRIDSITGDIFINPDTLFICTLAVRIEEWRHINGVPMMINYTIRDMQLNVALNCTNIIPTMAGINLNATQYSPNDTNYNLNFHYGDTVNINIYSYDADVPPQNLTMLWNGGIPDGNWSVTGNGTTNPVGHFHHDPFVNPFAIPICFTVSIHDNSCPFMGEQTLSYCLTDTSSVSIDSYAGGKTQFDIYPNPAKESINIIFASQPDVEAFIEIVSMDGKLLQYIPIKDKNTEINISALPSGVYFVKLSSNDGISVRKMIKQ